ncbi:uncharacterized protein LOC142986124 [Anticarsia gemmatalis]|uniref:uncharacterized protein LOC142986124 n=1 Tax=Anticarsia gemmatalis TaxID=129554 RepID=UPI003F7628E0
MHHTLAQLKYPPNLVLIALLTGGLTVTVSIIYILLSITLIVFRFNCEAGAAVTGAGYFWTSIFRAYILHSDCERSLSINVVTNEYTVFVLVAVTLAASVLCLVTAICLITIIQDVEKSQYVGLVAYTYVGSCVISLAVDLTTASFFGMDYAHLSHLLGLLNAGSASNYLTEVVRQGAFWLMTFALKGFFVHIINGVLITLLLVYVIEYTKSEKIDQHSIHKLGALNAFEQQSKQEDGWSQPEMFLNSPFARGPQINSAYVEDSTPPRSPMRQAHDPPRTEFFPPKSHLSSPYVEDSTPPRSPRRPDPPRNDYFPSSNNSFDRSDSWQHSSTPMQSARPFSYLEEIKRHTPTKLPPSPAVESPWRRDPWQPQAPPVPAPDYSPPARRLKSALKPAYM